jgi:hypothetical protein
MLGISADNPAPAVAASAAIKTRMNPVWDEKAAAGGGLLLSPRQKDRGTKKTQPRAEKPQPELLP